MARRIVLGEIDGSGNYGMKVSKAGFDAKTAADSDLIFSTAFNLFKIHSTGTTSVTIPARPAPAAPTTADGGAGALAAGTYNHVITFVVNGEESQHGAYSANLVLGANRQVSLTNIPLGPSGTTARKIYRTDAAQGLPVKLITTINDNTTTTATDNVPDASRGADAPSIQTFTRETLTTHNLNSRKSFLAFTETTDAGADKTGLNGITPTTAYAPQINGAWLGGTMAQELWVKSRLNDLLLMETYFPFTGFAIPTDTVVVRWYVLVETGE